MGIIGLQNLDGTIMPDSSFVQTIAGGVVSLATTLAVAWWSEHVKRTRDARGTAYALRASISSLLSIVRTRRYEKGIESRIETMRTGQLVGPLQVRVRRNYLDAYNKHIEKLGELDGDLPQQIATFFTNINSLLEDVDNAADGKLAHYNVSQLLEWEIEFHELLTSTMLLGEGIVFAINDRYPPRKPLWMKIPG